MSASTSSALSEAFRSLREDLIRDDGPHISTMRNFRYAILPYDPEEEFPLRRELHSLTATLRAEGWVVISISLQKLLLQRLRQASGGSFLPQMIAREKMFHPRSPELSLNALKSKVGDLIEGPGGIARDVGDLIEDLARAHPHRADRMVAFIGRAGALYPFFRVSALLRFLDSDLKQRGLQVPTVLLYPGEQVGKDTLRFMGELPPTADYRPRIYS